ncbi:MAG: type III PLP-dependent enzyme [Pseudomonadota bacterium]
MDCYKDAAHVAGFTRPHAPVICAREHAADKAARFFASRFPGETYYAVKANPAPWLLRALYGAGVTRFEAASIAEIHLVRGLFPDADIAFMHPVKAPEVIAEAYTEHGVRAFALDGADELEKVRVATNDASDLTLCLRLAVPNDHAALSLGAKFGAAPDEAPALLAAMRPLARRLGVTFHVGSQTHAPAAWLTAMDRAERAIVAAGVIVDVLDVGGGFPAPYPGMPEPTLDDIFRAIDARFETMLVAENCALWCEPGRALCAEAASLIVRVEARKGDRLYVNDGVYGALFDAGHLRWPFPARRVAGGASHAHGTTAYSLYGPTCDDIDFMPGPFMLPADVAVGDYLEIGMLGAYGSAMATRFNGFGGDYDVARVADAPMLSAYGRNSDAGVAAGRAVRAL